MIKIMRTFVFWNKGDEGFIEIFQKPAIKKETLDSKN